MNTKLSSISIKGGAKTFNDIQYKLFETIKKCLEPIHLFNNNV